MTQGRSYASRARDEMVRRFFDFYRERWAEINKDHIGENMWLLYNAFAAWLEEVRTRKVPNQTEKCGNIAMSRSLPSLGEFCAVYEAAAEQLIWETQRRQMPDFQHTLVSPSVGRGDRGPSDEVARARDGARAEDAREEEAGR